jgi:hypothetical protein
MKYLLLSLALTISACGPLPPEQVPPEVAPHIEEYKKTYAPNSTDGLEVEFDDLDSSIAGLCTRFSTGHKRVKLDRKIWDSFDYESRQVLVTHELGHCLEGFEHRGEIKGAFYTSIMYPYLVSSSMYRSKKAQYLKEFLTGLWE